MLTQIERLFTPRSIAIVGASADPRRTTGRPVRYLRKHGFGGTIYPVNPRYSAIDDLPCYASVELLPAAPDVGLVLVGPERVEGAIRQLAERGAAAAVVLAGGYAEAGPDGARRQAALKDAAGSMRLLGPNTIGLFNVGDRIAISASIALELDDIRPGSLAVVSQSGGMLGSLLSRGVGRGVGFSKLIATGNEVDLEVSEFVEHLLHDEATSAIALYLEGLRRPARFRAVAERAAGLSMPIVAYKVGRSEVGARSAASHTGALAGSDRVYDAFFAQCGVIRAASFSDLIDMPAALVSQRRPRGRRLAVLTTSGGAGALVADACGVAGFELPPPDPTTAARLGECLVGEGAVPNRNPIDLTLTGLRPEIFRAAISALLDSPTYDALIVVVGSSGLDQPELAAGPVIASLQESDKPVAVFVSPYAPNIVAHLNRHGVPAFDTPEGCSAALAAMLRSSQRRVERDRDRVPTVHVLERDGTDLPSGRLNEAESKRLFARFGIPAVDEVVASSADEAAAAVAGWDGLVVLKVLSRDILHKTECGGVLTNVRPSGVARACAELVATVQTRCPAARIEGFLVQRQVTGVELVLGFVRDPQLGPAVLLGAGGIATEVFADTAIRLPPIDLDTAEEMIRGLKVSVLLGGFRGRPAGDVEALAAAIVAFSAMVTTLGERLEEAEINPLFVLPAGEGVRAADGLAVLR